MNLPTWDEAMLRVKSGDSSALDRFIYDNEPADTQEAEKFREDLAEVITEALL